MAKVLMKLRLFRVEKGMTTEQFSEKIGYSRIPYSRIENGLVKPSTRFIESVANAFSITIHEAYELCNLSKNGKQD